MSEQDREKGPDEVYCTSCGVPIKKQAEICPNCGVRNTNRDVGSKTNAGGSPTASEHDPSQYETTVSDTWWQGVAAGVGLWVLALALGSAAGESLGPIAGLIVLLAWVGLPLSTYFDMQYVRANSQWNPNTALWVVLTAIWLVSIVAGVVYLYRRHEVLGEP